MGSTWEKCLRAGILWDLVYLQIYLVYLVFRCQVIVLQSSGLRMRTSI